MANSKTSKKASAKKESAQKKAADPTRKATPKKADADQPAKPLKTPRKRNDPDYKKQATSKTPKDDLVPKHISGEAIEMDGSFKPPANEPAILSDEDTGAGTGDEFVNETAFNEQAPEANPPSHLTDAPLKNTQGISFDRWYKELRFLAQSKFNFTIKEIGEFDSDKFKPYYENGDSTSRALEKERKKLDDWKEDQEENS